LTLQLVRERANPERRESPHGVPGSCVPVVLPEWDASESDYDYMPEVANVAVFAVGETTKLSHMPLCKWPGTRQTR